MQNWAGFHFWGRLRQLVSPAADGSIIYRFHGQPAIKDSVEALGVPHTEVDLLLVAGRSVAFDYRLQDADRVAVYPFGNSPQVGRLLHLSPPIPQQIAFILDVHLGKLARRLRILGFDCHYRNDYSDPQIIQLALAKELVILTRDRGILKHSCVSQGYLVGAERVEEQVTEVLRRYCLFDRIEALRRCPECNGLLEPVAKEQIIQRLPAKTACYYQDFQQCSVCRRIYWQGSHYVKLKSWVQQLREDAGHGGYSDGF